MERYDASGDVKPKGFFLRPAVIMLLIGAVMLVTGLIWIKSEGLGKYIKTYNADETIEGSEITELDIGAGLAVITISPSPDSDFHIVAEKIPYKLHHRVSNGRLYIDDDSESKTLNLVLSGIQNGKKGGTLDIQVPAKEYKKLRIGCAMAKLNVEDIKCTDLVFDCGMADVNVTGLICAANADIDIGMGDAEFKDCKFFKSNFEVGMSDFDYEGYLGAETNIRCGMGNADFVLDGKRSDYHIEGKKVSGEDNEDGILINVDSGVSDVDINFKK